MNIILILVFIIIILCSVYYFMNIHIVRKKSDIFLTKDELYNYLIKDSDNFYDKLKPIDLLVRKVDSVDEYKKKIYNSIDVFTLNEMRILMKSIQNCNKFLLTLNIPGFNGNKCKKIPWKIGCINGEEYEAGLPHTRGNVIIFPRYKLNRSEGSFTRTLIHERIHIYQKLYPNDIEIYLKDNGYKRFKPIYMTKTRANPDINEWSYLDKDGNIMSAEYNKNPKSITDVKFTPKNSSEYEHPLEKMAVDLSRQYKILR